MYVCITKVDMCPENVLEQTIERLEKVLKHPAVKKTPYFVKSEEDVVACARMFADDRVVPVFLVSSVTGLNYPFLRKFLNLLPVRSDVERDPSAAMEMHIDDIYSVPGVGTVVAGNVLAGTATAGAHYLLGPNCFGEWEEIGVKTIHSNRTPTQQVVAGQSASFGLKKVRRDTVRKGMVLVARELQPRACWVFHAEVLVLYHSTTIQVCTRTFDLPWPVLIAIRAGGVRGCRPLSHCAPECSHRDDGQRHTAHTRSCDGEPASPLRVR